MTHLSIDAKEFVPKVKENDKKPNNSQENSPLSVDVPEFVPKDNLTGKNTGKSKPVKPNSVEKKIVKNKDAKETSDITPRPTVNWAEDKPENKIDEFNARHDRGWFHRNPSEMKNQKDDLKRSDSYNVNSLDRLNQHNKIQLMHTYSTGFSEIKQKRKLHAKHSLRVEEPKDVLKQTKSWSAIVKTTSSLKPSNNDVDNRRSSLTPNTGHSRDLRTMSYDVERDKRAKLNKLKKTSSLLGSLDTTQNSSPKSLQKRLNHKLLTESKSLGPYDIDLKVPKPRIDIKRKSLVLEAKRSASIKQDPAMDNWFEKDLPATIELFSTLTKSPDLIESPPPQLHIKPTEKRKLTRTTKKVFSPSAVTSDFADKRSINDNYFFNDIYKDSGSKKESGHMIEEDTNESAEQVTTKQPISNDVQISNAPLSYSSMLKRTTPLNITPSSKLQPNDSDESVKLKEKPILTSEEIRLLKKTKKKEKKKIKKQRKIEERKQELAEQGITEEPRTSNKKKEKRRKEIPLDLSEMVGKLIATPKPNNNKTKSKQGKGRQKRVVISTGVVSVVSGLAKKNKHDGKRTARNKYGGTGIIMDGATPIVIRGKERQTPKRKKPTLLKKIIQAERERKRHLQESSTTKTDTSSQNNETSTEVHFNETSKESSTQNDEGKVISADDDEKSPISADVQKNEENKDTDTEAKKFTLRPCEPLSKLPEELWKQVHSRKFREYCDHVITKEINDLTYQLLITLQRFQDRVYHDNPAKFKQRRRFVLGLREVLKHTKLKKIKAIIVAPNLERISSEGGLDDYLRSILLLCDEYELPKIFALNRHGLGKTLKKKAPVSIIGIFSYDGAQDTFKELLSHVDEARKVYSRKIHDLLNNKNTKYNHSSEIENNQKTIPSNETINFSRSTIPKSNDKYVDNTQNEAVLLRQKMITNLKDKER